MDIFDKINDTIISASKEVGQKAKDVSDIVKLQYELREKESALSEKYEELGKAYYEERKDEEEMAEIRDLISGVAELKEQIMDLKGAKACPSCGAKVSDNAAFCSACGAKLNDMFEEE